MTSLQAVERTFRASSGQALATVARIVRSIDLAEEAVQDAFAEALRTWPERGVPSNPGGWITTTARNRAFDRLRRESRRADKEDAATRELIPGWASPGGRRTPAVIDDHLDDVDALEPVPDDQLRLIFTCCHPAMSVEAQVALTLRLVCGLSSAEIARAFLVPETTIAQRLTRAKRRIRDAGIPLRLPPAERLHERLQPVLATIYLVFREGYAATSGEVPIRAELSTEAVRLATLLAELVPDDPEVLGLLALVRYQDARRDARLGPDGEVVLLEAQDRGRWDAAAIASGDEAMRRAAAARQVGPYQLQAAIAAEHVHARTWEETDWREIRRLYDLLASIQPTPAVRLNRAIAISFDEDAAAGLDAVAELVDDPTLARSAHLAATRADLLRRLGHVADAHAAYDVAAGLAATSAERALLERRRDALAASQGAPTPDEPTA